MPGTMRRVDTRGRAAIAEAQEQVGVVEELRDRARRAGVDLALELVEVELGARRLRMLLRIRGDGDLEVTDASSSPLTRSAA